MKLGPYDLDQIYTGDARELAREIPNESVDLILTDPPYSRDKNHLFAEMGEYAFRVLKTGASLITLCGQLQVPVVIGAMRDLNYHWLGWLENKGWQRPTLFGSRVVSCGKPIIWFSKGNPKINGFWWDYKKSEGGDKRFHEWGQSEGYVIKDILSFTDSGSIVFDPFTGGGTVPAVCKMLGRHYLAFEIVPDVAERARQRVEMTQPPLLIPQPEQAELL